MKQVIKKTVLMIFHIPYSWICYYFKMAIRFYTSSAASKNEDDMEWMMTKLKILTHEIDKGLAMPRPRDGFGKQKVSCMVKYMKKYLNMNTYYEYDAYIDAREILEKYIEARDAYNLDTSFIDLEEFPVEYNKTSNRMAHCNRVLYNDCTNMNFKEFAEARHSVRFFKENCPVQKSVVEMALEIARTAPSACNRQSVKVKLINEKSVAREILQIQGGTAGFENADNCILVMVDLSNYWYRGEMNTAFVDSGIFIMNFIYSLKYLGVDSCPLIWDDNSKKRNELNKFIELEPNMYITTIMAIGYANEKAKILYSPRKSTDNILV